MKLKLLSVAILSVLAISACTSTTSGGAVDGDRSQIMLISSEEVNNSAAQAYREVMEDARSKRALNVNAAQVARVRAISDRLIKQTATFRPDAPSWKWEVNVLSSKTVNAWCMPGGKMAVYTGIIEQLNLTDDELAAIMGHEIAHALREHGREKMSKAAAVGTATSIGSKAISARYKIGGSTTKDILDTVGDLAFMKPNSREMETESDRIGIELAARAGYNPEGAISLWQKMAKLGSGGPEFLSTHPSNESRIADLTVYVERVRPLYVEALKNQPKAPATKGGKASTSKKK